MTKRDSKNGYLAVMDLVRADVTVGDADDIIEVYSILEKAPQIEMVRITNNMREPGQCITLNFIYLDCIIGEINASFKEKHGLYYQNRFLGNL